MADRVLVMCATRNRPRSVNRMIDSVLRTSTNADVAVYVDEDQEAIYAGIDRRATVVVGKRHGQCVALNSLHKGFPGYLAYGAATDDCEFVTPGWDRWVIAQSKAFEGGIGALAPLCDRPERMDFPWFTARWLEVAGYFVPLGTEHFFWDVALEVVAEQVAIAYARKEDFAIRHHDENDLELPEDRHGMNNGEDLRLYKIAQDSRFACAWLAEHRRGLVATLRRAVLESRATATSGAH